MPTPPATPPGRRITRNYIVQTHREYDALNRVQKEITPYVLNAPRPTRTRVITYTYDTAGRLTDVASSGQQTNR